MSIFVGIDPGWANLGFAIVKQLEDGRTVAMFTKTYAPRDYPSIVAFVNELVDAVKQYCDAPECVTIERFVAYQGIHASESENINMLIGALMYAFGSNLNTKVRLVRAIDWKTTLVKLLYKQKQFENPSSTLDKKFSFAAAAACLDTVHEIKLDHEADAVCLASLPIYAKKGA